MSAAPEKTSDELLVRVDNASFGYDGRIVLIDANFCINKGDYVCVVGPNGSGKSTLINGLLRLKSPVSGKLRFAPSLKQSQVGYMPQKFETRDDFPASVYEIALSGRLGGKNWQPFYSRSDHKAAMQSLSVLHAEALRSRRFNELSGGQQQRVLLARAVCAAEALLVLDEPAAGLDAALQLELEQTISSLNADKRLTIVMVSHDISNALRNASHILHLDTKQLFFGTVAEYKKSGIGEGFIGCFHEGHHGSVPADKSHYHYKDTNEGLAS